MPDVVSPLVACMPDTVTPLVFLSLTYKFIALRPLDLHNGDYLVKQHGYRKKTRPTMLSWSAKFPQDKINDLSENGERRTFDFVRKSNLNEVSLPSEFGDCGSNFECFVRVVLKIVQNSLPVKDFTA